MPPHVWTLEEIKSLPEFGAEDGMGWFYGLVFMHDEETEQDAVVLAEIFPGMGYVLHEPPDDEQWSEMLKDFDYYKP